MVSVRLLIILTISRISSEAWILRLALSQNIFMCNASYTLEKVLANPGKETKLAQVDAESSPEPAVIWLLSQTEYHLETSAGGTRFLVLLSIWPVQFG